MRVGPGPCTANRTGDVWVLTKGCRWVGAHIMENAALHLGTMKARGAEFAKP